MRFNFVYKVKAIFLAGLGLVLGLVPEWRPHSNVLYLGTIGCITTQSHFNW